MTHLFLLLFFAVMMASCSTTSKPSVFDPIDVAKIQLVKSVPMDSIGILSPIDMLLADNYLIVSQDHIDSQLVQVFDLKTLQNTDNFGKLGEALYEVLSLGNIDIFKHNDSLRVGIVDYDRRGYHEYTVGDKTHNRMMFLSPKECDHICRLGNEKMLVSTVFDSTKFFLYSNSQIVDSLSLFPPKADNVGVITHSMACSGWLSTNPDKTLIVASYIYDGGIDVLECVGDKLVPKWSFRLFNMDYAVESRGNMSVPIPTKQSRYGYTYSTLSDKYIYALYSGKLLSEDNTGASSIIHIFDYNGTHIREIKLDHAVTHLCVDRHDKNLYCIATNDQGYPMLEQYDLMSSDIL